MPREIIGWASSRVEGQMFEQQLRSHGIPALLDLGLFAIGYAESQMLEITIDEEALNSESAFTIGSILGPFANQKLLNRYREKTMTPVEEISWVPVGWFSESEKAETAGSTLKGHGIYCEIEDEDGQIGIFVVERKLTADSLAVIAKVLGENADAEIIAEYTNLLMDRDPQEEFCLVRTPVDNVADWAVSVLEEIGILAYAVPVDDEFLEVRCPADSINVNLAKAAVEKLGDYATPELLTVAGIGV